ncbi:hypothetical protein [Capillimicrobium parvum]|uniref:Uncharacterized protein n=1 Tax=Capillimicrobium parvum TaxID=2884022 RepID=A0A9E6XUY4_9ACTN|nr:hypothetical protein [Capillimicrobium parvum]UGS34252.1 hypothetical protein DSM104329_00628 [Capillimicrobium parvum]
MRARSSGEVEVVDERLPAAQRHAIRCLRRAGQRATDGPDLIRAYAELREAPERIDLRDPHALEDAIVLADRYGLGAWAERLGRRAVEAWLATDGRPWTYRA